MLRLWQISAFFHVLPNNTELVEFQHFPIVDHLAAPIPPTSRGHRSLHWNPTGSLHWNLGAKPWTWCDPGWMANLQEGNRSTWSLLRWVQRYNQKHIASYIVKESCEQYLLIFHTIYLTSEWLLSSGIKASKPSQLNLAAGRARVVTMLVQKPLLWCTLVPKFHFRSMWSGFKEIGRNKVSILFKEYTRLAQFFMTDFLKRDLSVFHWHGYKCMIFEIFDKIQPSACKVNQAWSAGHLEGSMNMNLTCKISKKFHIPKQTPSTGGSSRQSHSRCSVHLYILTHLFKQLAKQSLQVACCGKRSCFACDTPSLASWWHLPPKRLPGSVCFGRYLCHDQWRSIFWMIKLHNSTKKVEHQNHSLLTRTELDKNSLFWWHDFFAQQLGAVLPTQLRLWSIDVVRQGLHGCSMFRFLRPDGSLSGWLQRMLSGCYQMRRIRRHLVAAGPNAWQYELSWYINDPCPRSRPHHRWYPHTGGGNTSACYGDYYCSSPYYCCCCYYCNLLLQPARPPPRAPASLVDMTITDHNKPCSWGPRRKSSHRSGGWKTCQCSSIGCNSSSFSLFFLFFMSTLLIFVDAACQCLSMVGHNCFHDLIYHLRSPAGWTGPKSTWRSRNSACWNPSRWDIPSIHIAKYSYIQQKNRISKSPSPWKKTRNWLVSNFLRQSRALRKLTKWKWVRHCSKKCSIKVPGLAQWKNGTTLWGQEFGNRSQRVVRSTRFDPHFGEDVCGTTVKTFFLSRSVVPWETSLAPCHGKACIWWHNRRRRGTGWNWFGKTPLFLKVGGLNACWNSSKSLPSLENLSESRANQIEVRDCHDLPKFPRSHLVWTWMLYPSDEIDKSLERSAGLSQAASKDNCIR